MSYWTVVPTAVRKSKRLSSEEKELYYEIFDRLNEGGYCTDTNEVLAKSLGISLSTLGARLANLKKKRCLKIIINLKNHTRRIYLIIPRDPDTYAEGFKPAEEKFDDRKRRLQESLKKAIVLGTIDFDVLVAKLKESTYLEEVEDNSTQFVLNEEQIEFLYNFKRFFKKPIDCQVSAFEGVDYKALIKALEQSWFLQDNKNLTLKWVLAHSREICDGKYKQFLNRAEENSINKPNFKQREYSPEDLAMMRKHINDDLELLLSGEIRL